MRALSPQRRPPRPPQFAVDLLEETLFRLKGAVKGPDRRRRRAHRASRDARLSTGYGAPLTAPFNRNFRLQEIDGEWLRPLRSEPAAGAGSGKTPAFGDAGVDSDR